MIEIEQVIPMARATDSHPVARLDLYEEARLLRASPMPHGHVSKSLLHDRDLRIVLMVLARGTQVASHHANTSLVLQVLDGRIIVGLLASSFDLDAGRLLAIQPNIEHSLVAIQDSVLMLTIGRAGG